MPSQPTLPPPARALFALLRGDAVEASSQGSAQAGVDWDAVGVYAHATGLGPLLLQNAGAQLPPMLATRLRLTARRTQARNTTLLAGLSDLLHACQAEDLPLLVLKGAYLAPAVYRDLGLRGMTDVDVLVRPADFPRLQAILGTMGYAGKHTDPEKGPGIVKHEWTYKAAADVLRPPASSATNPYLFADNSFHLEPHTSLTESWFGLRLDLSAGVWERAIAWEWEGVPALALHPIDCLLHIAVHLIFHLLMGKPALVQLYDLRRLLESHPDLPFDDPPPLDGYRLASTKPGGSEPSRPESGLLSRARAAGATAHLLAGLRLAHAAYAAPVPVGWLERLAAASPPPQRAQAEALDLPGLWNLTQQAPLTTLRQRLRRGVHDRALAAGWARDRREAWRVWQSALVFHRTDTATGLATSLRQRLAADPR